MYYKKGNMKQVLALLLAFVMIITSIRFTSQVVQAEEKQPISAVFKGTGYEVEFKVTSSWTGAFNADVIITNTGDKVIDNWALSFVMPHKITNIWNGKVYSNEEDLYIVKNATWNQDVGIGKKVSFGFTATYTDNIQIPKSFMFVMNEKVLDDSQFTVEMGKINDWKSAFNGELVVCNVSEINIEDWIIEFDYPYNITQFYTGEILSNKDDHYVVKNRGYNTNIKAKEELALGFSAYPGNVTEQLTNVIIKTIEVDEDMFQKDFDADNLTNEMELYYGTSPYENDTDNDGINDYFEIIYNLNPTLQDTDGNGILDGNEDIDKDKLTISQEFDYGTDNLYEDTDSDVLTDYDEIFIYGTDPLKVDTDGDGISDGSEIKLGLDPLRNDTDGNGILDGNEKVEQSISKEIISDEKEGITKVSISMKGTGDIEETTVIENTYGIDTLSSEVVGIVGVPVDISTSSEFEEATITFAYDDEKLGAVKEEDLRVMWYDEESNQYIIMDDETVLNTEQNTVSYTTTHFSTYLVVDRQAWYDVWSNALSYRRQPTNPSVPMEYFDIGYVIDRSGSMSGTRITNAKMAIESFINAMYDNDRGAIIGFNSTASIFSEFTSDKDVLLSSLSSINASGGTSVEAGLKSALNLFSATPEKIINNTANSKMILLLCDGDVNYTEATLQRAKDMGIKIYPVLIGSSSGQTSLQRIADSTGGKFFYASTADEIRKSIFGVQDETIGDIDTTDTDGDGLYDIYETAGMILPNGQYVYTDPLLTDTEQDGLTDAEEMGVIESYESQDVLKKFVLTMSGFDHEVYADYFDYKSNPTKKDSDIDGYEDKEDPRPLISDVKIAKLTHVTSYVPVEYNGPEDFPKELYYGGNQSWFYDDVVNSSKDDKYIEKGCCGALASMDLVMYLALYHTDIDLSQLIKLETSDKYSNAYISYEKYTNFVREFIEKNPPMTYQFLWMDGTLGYLPFIIDLNLTFYFDTVDINKKVVSERTETLDRNEMLERIINQVERDIPVPIMAGFGSSTMTRIDPKTGEVMLNEGVAITSKLTQHWVNIVGVTVDKVKGTTMLEVASWGKKYLVSFDEYYEESGLLDGVIWID